MQPLISLQNIVKNYRRHRALDGIDLEIKPGITGLLGPNGAGKSTLIKMILGLVRLTSGSGTVLGHRLYKDAKKIRNDIGYMPEDDCYIPGMSGVEVVQFAACLSGLPGVEAMRRAHEILDFCDMKQERYRAIETFSTGMRQKVKFAAAIVHDPKFLILDEPTSGLDPEEREALLRRIEVLYRDSNKSVLISTHILPDVQAICDSVVILSKGKVRLDQSLSSLNATTEPTVEVLLHQPPAAFIEQLSANGLDHELGVNGRMTISKSPTEAKSTEAGVGADSGGGDLTELVWRSAAASGVTIESLQPAKNSLETIFMDTVQEAARADS